jgi:CHAT domain-containing protein
MQPASASTHSAATGRSTGADLLDPEVAEALGGRLIAEELRGDLAAARAAADAALQRAGRRRSERARAAAQAGIVTLLQGEPGRARPLFDQAIADDRHGPHAQTSRAYRLLAERQNLEYMPGGWATGASSLFALERRRRPKDEAALAARPGLRFLADLPEERGGLAILRPAKAEDLEIAIENLPRSLPTAWQPFRELALADLARGGGLKREAESRLKMARAAYRRAGDRAGIALCDLILSDWRAAPYSSPLTRYLDKEVFEEDPRGSDVAGARRLLDRAADGFARARAPRGLAAVELRRGWLDVLEGDLHGAARRAASARDAFVAAGDVAGGWLSAAHVTLARLAAGEDAADSDFAGGLAEWGRRGALAYAYGIGELFTGAGVHWRVAGDPNGALAANRVGQEVLAQLGLALDHAYALAERADTHAWIGELSRAALLLEDAMVPARAGIESVRPRTGGPDVVALENTLQQRRRLLHTLEDAPGLDRVQADIRWLGEARERSLRAQSVSEDAIHATGVRWEMAGEEDGVLAWIFRAWGALDHDEAGDSDTYVSRAMEAAQSAVHIPHLLEARVHLVMGDSLAARRAAHDYLDQGLPFPDLVDRREDFRLLVEVADYDGARKLIADFEAADPAWWNDHRPPWLALDGLAQVLLDDGRHDEALARFELALELIEGEGVAPGRAAQRSADPRAAAEVYAHVARAALDAGQSSRAFGYLERRKGRRLLELAVSGAAAARFRRARHPDALAWRELVARLGYRLEMLRNAIDGDAADATIAAAGTAVEEDQRALQKLEERLTREDPRWTGLLRPQVATRTLEEVADTLPAGTALLHYTLADDTLIGVAVTRDGFAAAACPPIQARVLGAEIARWRIDTGVGFDRAWEARAKSLGDLFLGPFKRVLADHEHLWIVPSGPAHGLPFAALHRGDVPLVTSHTVSVLPNAAFALQLERPADPLRGRALFLGNPDGMAWPTAPDGKTPPAPRPLPWSAAEAAYGAARFGIDPLLADAASEPGLRDRLAEAAHANERHGLVFLATHGELSDPPLASPLLLADGESLSLFELLGMWLDAELVVLSACETGRAHVQAGDDVQGFGSAVLAAGALGALVTLWRVNDGGTAILMRTFLDRIVAGDEPRLALATAQRTLRELGPDEITATAAKLRDAAADAGQPLSPGARPPSDLRHPKYWAPSVLLGR